MAPFTICKWALWQAIRKHNYTQGCRPPWGGGCENERSRKKRRLAMFDMWAFPNVWACLMMSAPCLALDPLWIMMLPKRGCFIFLCSLLFAPVPRLHSYILIFTASGLPSSLSGALAVLTMSCGPQGGWDGLNVKLGGEEGRPRLTQVTLELEALTAFMRTGVYLCSFVTRRFSPSIFNVFVCRCGFLI